MAAMGPLAAGLRTGAITSTVSTLVVHFGARLAGRVRRSDWMGVATVPLRDRALHEPPRRRDVAAGIAVHQFADVLWAAVYVAALSPVAPQRRRARILRDGLPWAVATAAVEYYVFLPWLQPLLRMQVPFWTAAGVHVSSAAAYPAYLALEGPHRRFGRWWMAALGAGLAALAVLGETDRRGRAPRWPAYGEGDRAFLHHMHGHHAVGLRLARLAAARSQRRRLRALGRLMAAEHAEQLELLEQWWASWEGGAVPELDAASREAMPGMPSEAEVDAVAQAPAEEFDHAFVDVMVRHHWGAVRMAERERRTSRDPRLVGFCLAVTYAQRRQITAMHDAAS